PSTLGTLMPSARRVHFPSQAHLLLQLRSGRRPYHFSYYDRMVMTGTLPQVCYAEGMTSFLYGRGVRIFDYPRFAEPLRDAIRTRAQELAQSAGIEIEHIAKAHIRKEDVVAKVIKQRGEHAGLVHVISAMEACQSYKPWHD